MTTSIIDKIKKLLALATSDNVNEASTAAAAAQKLMTQHRISAAEVEGHSTSSGQVEEILNTEFASEKSLIPWKSRIASGLAKANGCEIYHGRHHTGVKTMYIGPASGLATMQYMYQYLVREVDRLAAAERGRPGVDRTYLTSFRYGAAKTIAERLQESAQETMAEASGTALAVINRDEERVKEVLASMALRPTKTRLNDKTGYERGRAAGKTVNLNTGKALGKGSDRLKD